MELAARVAEQAAGDVVIARCQLGRDRPAQAGRDILALLHHQNAVENLPFDGPARSVDDLEGGSAGWYRDLVGIAAAIGDGDRQRMLRHCRCGALRSLRGGIEQDAGDDHQKGGP
jgi:hypothetical protein